MALKKAYCVKCNHKNDKIRIFDVNPDATICYCPYCMSEYEPKEVVDAYNHYIQKQIDDSYHLLYERTEFKLAYTSFAKILELDHDVIEARFGRALSLIYLSTLRRARFSDATTLIEEEADLYYRKVKNNALYYKFLKRAFFAVNEYDKHFRKKMMTRSHYYDDECVKLMYYRVKEIKDFKEFLYKETFALSEKCDELEIGVFAAAIKDSAEKSERELKDKVSSLDGFEYSLTGFSTMGGVLLSKVNDLTISKTSSRNMKSLKKGDKKTSLIKDEVVPDNKSIYHFIREAIPWEIISFVLGVALFVLSFILQNQILLIAFSILASTFISITIFLVTLSIICYLKIRKRHHLIK